MCICLLRLDSPVATTDDTTVTCPSRSILVLLWLLLRSQQQHSGRSGNGAVHGGLGASDHPTRPGLAGPPRTPQASPCFGMDSSCYAGLQLRTNWLLDSSSEPAGWFASGDSASFSRYSVFLSQQTSRNSVFQLNFKLANGPETWLKNVIIPDQTNGP